MASLFYSYSTYENTAWCSTTASKLKKLAIKQRHAIKVTPVPIVHVESKSREIMRKILILNLYKT